MQYENEGKKEEYKLNQYYFYTIQQIKFKNQQNPIRFFSLRY